MPLRLSPRPQPKLAPPAATPLPPFPAEVACRGWYEAYGQPVYSYLRFHLPSADVAEDLTAEVFFRAVRGFERFDPVRGAPQAWLFRIAQNVLRDYRRQVGRRRTVSLTDLRDLRSAAPSPEERLLWEEDVARLLSAISELPPRDREIISLSYGTELTVEEIGQVLGVKGGAVRTRLWRALARLRKVLSE
jgi:RNA polymerase sigma-70 factor (ECF subfamily)